MKIGIANSVKARVRECTPALFNEAIDAPETAKVCAEIADALESCLRGEMTREDFETYKSEQKKLLPIFTPHATFKNGRRVNEEAVPSGLSMYDVDHISDPRTYYAEKVQGRQKELGVVFGHVTPSTEGLRLFFFMPEGMSLDEAQKWMSHQLGDDHYDGCVKDYARCSFAVPRSYVLYVDEEWLADESYTLTPTATSILPFEISDKQGEECLQPQSELSFKGIPYVQIIDAWWNMKGGTPAEGERNVKLHQLAVNLRAICDNNPAVLMQILPRLGLPESEIRSIAESACREQPKGISKQLQQIINAEHMKQREEIPVTALQAGDYPSSETFSFPWKKLPIGLRESAKGVPEDMILPRLAAVMPVAFTYADGAEVEYIDGDRQQLAGMTIIVGEQASYKSVCKKIVDLWKRPLEEEDAIARKREEEWKQRKKNRKANEKIPDDPEVLIRLLPVTVSCSTLLKRLKYAKGHALFSFGEELDTLRKTNGAGSWSSKYDIYRLSFDHGEWGQDYNSDQAESGMVEVAYNWAILGTYGALRRCFKSDNIENGLSSRILPAEMPDMLFAAMPRFQLRTTEEEARIDQAVNMLRRAHGFIDTPRLRKGIGQWVEEKRLEAAREMDRVKDVYRRRAAVIGFRCGVVFYLLSGEKKESKACVDFARMMAEHTLQTQMKLFGETLMSQYVKADDEARRYTQNHSIFDELPVTFGLQEVRNLKGDDYAIETLRTIICRWVKMGWIAKTGKGQWTKNIKNEKTLRHYNISTLQ